MNVKVGIGTAIRAASLFMLLLSILPGFAQTPKGLVLLKREHSFDTIPEEGRPVSFSFRFAWNGPEKLPELDAVSPCGCVQTQVFGSPFKPGDSGWVKVTFDPFSRPGPFGFEIPLEGEDKIGTVEVNGYVSPRKLSPRELLPFESGSLRFRMNHLTFGKMLDTQTDTMRVEVFNQGKKPVRLDLSRSRIPRFVKVSLSQNSIAPGAEMLMTVVYQAPLRKSWGWNKDTFFLATDDVKEARKTFWVSADIRHDFRAAGEKAKWPGPDDLVLSGEKFSFGKGRVGDATDFRFVLKNQGHEPILVKNLWSMCECLEAVSLPPIIPPGDQVELSGKVRLNGPPRTAGITLNLVVAIPGKERVELTLTGDITD